MSIKSDFKEIYFETCSKWPKLQEASVDIKILSPGGCLPLTIMKSWKDVYKVRLVEEIFLNLQQMTKVMRPSCWHQNCDPNALSVTCTCIKSWKNVHKIKGQCYCFKYATSDQSETFQLPSKQLSSRVVFSCAGAIWSDTKILLTSVLCSLGAVCPLPWGYIHVLNHEKNV